MIYERAIKDDGSLWFPERLTHEFLEQQRKLMGSYIFANQYQNEVIPLENRTFKLDWIKIFTACPQMTNTFCFIDPAIGQGSDHDFTGVVVVKVCSQNNWYVEFAQRYKITPTELVELVFKLSVQFKPMIIGIEDVAYQKALLYMVDSESRRRGIFVPIMGVRADNQKSKEMRILGLTPRFEFGRVFLKQGMNDLMDELLKFPRGKHDDLLDSLAYIDQIAVVPTNTRSTNVKLQPHQPGYEQQYIANLYKKTSQEDND